MKPLLVRLFEKWRRDGVAARPPVESAVMRAFEERYGVRLPADLRDYFAACDGMEDVEMDSDLFSFWGLSRVRPITEELPEPEYEAYRGFPGAGSFFCFADWSIDAEVFTIELHADPASTNRMFALGPRPLAVTGFGEFVEIYLSDYRALLG